MSGYMISATRKGNKPSSDSADSLIPDAKVISKKVMIFFGKLVSNRLKRIKNLKLATWDLNWDHLEFGFFYTIGISAKK